MRILLISIVLAGTTFVVVPPAAAATCGQILVSGSSWLGGSGVDVHSNGANQGTGTSCAGYTTGNPSVQDGGGWQCVELAARLYYIKGWGTVRAGGNSSARYLPEGSSSLTFHRNGDGYVPVPGDLIVEDGGVWGHVTVVDSVGATTIAAVEQNASVSGRRTYTRSGSAITSGSATGSVRGVLHSPKNTTTNPPPTIATAPALSSGALASLLGARTVCANAHVQGIGWQGWRCTSPGGSYLEVGTTGQSRRIEAVAVAASQTSQVCAQAHVQGIGWQPKQCSHAFPAMVAVGTTGHSLRMEAIRISTDGKVCARAHVQNIGWQAEQCATSIEVGTTGRSLRMEALRLRL